MNKKLGILLTSLTLASCNAEGNNKVVNIENDTNSQIFGVVKDESIEGVINSDTMCNYTEILKNDSINYVVDSDTTANNSETIEKGSVYENLIQKITTPIVSGDVTKPEVSITIDDGCGAKYTEQILDTLAKYNVKVTFFIPGTRIKLHAEQRKRAIKEGHQVCCHSFDHHYFRASEPALLRKQILDWEAAVKDNLGEEYLIRMKRDFPFFRFPGGCGDSKPEHIAVLKELGYLPFGRSDCTWKDGQNLNNGEIELFHVKPADFSRISNCIQQAQAQGLECKTLTEIVDPNKGYEEPITGKNLRKKRKEAKEIIEQK